jgi:hypothetical protein
MIGIEAPMTLLDEPPPQMKNLHDTGSRHDSSLANFPNHSG